MKKSLLLAALLLSSATQAETWVCSTPLASGGSYLHKLVRQETDFSYILIIPAGQQDAATDLDLGPLKILVETDAMLTLADIKSHGETVDIFMVNKQTKRFIVDAVYFDMEGGKEFGSCIEI